VRLQRLELEEISITAVAYLPDAVLDALALPSCPRPNHPAVTRVTVEVWASAHIPGFFLPLPDDNDEDEDHPGEVSGTTFCPLRDGCNHSCYDGPSYRYY
jgi:hypothetical protein